MTWQLYFQTGFKEGKAAIAASGEPTAAAFVSYMETFKIQPLSITELFQCNVRQSQFKAAMVEWWSSTLTVTKSGKVVDGIICPVHPSSSLPHNFPSWLSYTSLWNILDYPAVTIPVKGFRLSPETDQKDLNYTPLNNPFDQGTYEMCTSQCSILIVTC